MNIGINAMRQKWPGAMVKRSYFHQPGEHADFPEILTVQYQGVSHERATKVYHYSEHEHDNHEVLFVDKGCYICDLNGCALELKGGEVLIIGPGDRHADVCRPPLEYYSMWFSLKSAGSGGDVNILRKELAPTCHICAPDLTPFLVTIKAIIEEEQRRARFSVLLQQAMAQEIIWRLMEAVPQEYLNPLLLKQTQEAELLAKLTRIFDSNVNKPLTVNEMARALMMSASSLAHTCTNLLGISPAKAFTRYRMEKALRMLRFSNLSIKEIAAELGFHDESHFIHAFRRSHNTSPGAFRNANAMTQEPEPST